MVSFGGGVSKIMVFRVFGHFGHFGHFGGPGGFLAILATLVSGGCKISFFSEIHFLACQKKDVKFIFCYIDFICLLCKVFLCHDTGPKSEVWNKSIIFINFLKILVFWLYVGRI